MRASIVAITASKVYFDSVPEGNALPAIAISHISNVRGRMLAGVTTTKTDTWRLTLACKTRAEVDVAIAEIEAMDGKNNDSAFQSIQVITVIDEPRLVAENTFRAFVDIQTWDR